jgi:hypothetical protein
MFNDTAPFANSSQCRRKAAVIIAFDFATAGRFHR